MTQAEQLRHLANTVEGIVCTAAGTSNGTMSVQLESPAFKERFKGREVRVSPAGSGAHYLFTDSEGVNWVAFESLPTASKTVTL